MNYIVFDLETLGLNIRLHQTVQIGAIALNEKYERLDVFSQYIKPIPPILFESNALKVNNLSIEWLLENGQDKLDVWRAFSAWVNQFRENDRAPAAINHNKVFDFARLIDIYMDLGLELPFNFSNVWDTKDRAYDLIPGIKSTSLQNLCTYFKIPYVNAHDALVDATLTADVWRHLAFLRNKILNLST